MTRPAKVVTLAFDSTDTPEETRIQFKSGRQVKASSGPDGEQIQVKSQTGDVLFKLKLDADVPELILEGVRLRFSAAESISMSAKTIELDASEHTRIRSKGKLNIEALDQMGIHSDDDVRVNGKMIYLN